MKPVDGTAAGVGDLLERVLEKGVVIRLDLVISVAGIPLIGLGAQLAVASIETMTAYGVLGGWTGELSRSDSTASRRNGGVDRESPNGGVDRESPNGAIDRESHNPPSAVLKFGSGEHEVLNEFVSLQVREGWASWRPCRLQVTNQRMMLTRAFPAEVMMEVELDDIRAVGCGSAAFGGVVADVVGFELADGVQIVLRASRSGLVAASLRDVLHRRGREIAELDLDRLEGQDDLEDQDENGSGGDQW